ncbi:MAG: class I SAM-dependent methyltransferase [Chloroflexota bacterium]|nr:class I SAM-dependent methyltransferase [Chloroflexota bacterium]
MKEQPGHQPSPNAAQLGEPSYVWRAGQDRRLEMIRHWGQLDRAQRILDVGTGLGLYLEKMKAVGPRVTLATGTEYEFERAHQAGERNDVVVAAEPLPFPDNFFDLVLSHEVLEHVGDDALAASEIVRVLCLGGRAVIFVPNRLWLFETHGIYWDGKYYFGNKFGVNYLPDPLRNRLAPHVRSYTASGLRRLFDGLPMEIIHHTQVFPGYDNIVRRRPILGRLLRTTTHALEVTPLRAIGLSHLLVIEKEGEI